MTDQQLLTVEQVAHEFQSYQRRLATRSLTPREARVDHALRAGRRFAQGMHAQVSPDARAVVS
jgi:hypothetical protein